VLSSVDDLGCDVKQYPTGKLPLVVRVYPTITVTAGTTIEIWLSPIVNPSAVMVAGAEVRVTVDCQGEQRCTVYRARGYFRTVSSYTITDYANTTGSFTASNTEVLKQAVSHSFGFNSIPFTAVILDYP
jgi:hypothetical protein